MPPPPFTLAPPRASVEHESRPGDSRCPRCGTPRVGAFRYCRSCGWDFEPGHIVPASLTAANPGTVDTRDPLLEAIDRWVARGFRLVRQEPDAAVLVRAPSVTATSLLDRMGERRDVILGRHRVVHLRRWTDDTVLEAHASFTRWPWHRR